MNHIINKYNKLIIKNKNKLKTKKDFILFIKDLKTKIHKRHNNIKLSGRDYGRTKYTSMHIDYLSYLEIFGWNIFKYKIKTNI